MPLPLVLVYEPPSRRGIDAQRREHLQARFGSAVRFEFVDDRADVSRLAPDARVIAGRFTPADFSRAPQLEWCHSWAVGVEGQLFPELVRSPVVLTCSRGNGAIPLAEHAMLLMLALNRNFPRWLDAQRAHRWERFTHGELNGRTCGIIGLGHSGTDLAQKAKAFHMHVLGVRRKRAPVPFVDEVMGPDRLGDLLSRSDFVVITAPLTDETRGLIGEAELRLMKPTAVLVCFSRGGIIDDAALVRALTDGWIAGAGLDAHGTEPLPPDSPFWDLPNVIVTPHNGATSPETLARGADVFEENLERYLDGRPLVNVVDKSAGY